MRKGVEKLSEEENMNPRKSLLRILAIILFALPLLALHVSSHSQQSETQTQEEKKPEVRPASLAGFSDEGIIRLYVNEEPLVTSEFKWEKSGLFTNTSVIALAGQTVKTVTTIVPDESGRWIKITQETPQGTMEFIRKKAGKQTLQLFIIPGAMVEAPLEFQEIVERKSRHDRRVLCRLGAVVGGPGETSSSGDNHPQRLSSRPFLQHSL